MSKITLYTTGCPNCVALEGLLKRKGISPDEIIKDHDIFSEREILSVPILEIDDKRMVFYEAVQWVNQQ